MLLDAIGITDVALTDSSRRKEKVMPELPLVRLLRESGVPWTRSRTRQ
jgi:Tat protein secretion system quality control protein TatD with DNase activity